MQEQKVEDQLDEEVAEKAEAVEEQFAAADAAADPDIEAPKVEDIASRMGWVPKEKFKGPEEKWKPADQFILDGHDIQTARSRELKEMRQTLDSVARTSGQIMADKLREQHEALSQKYAAAVEKGDPDEAFAASRDIIALKMQDQPTRQAPAPEAVSWVENTKFMKPGTPDFDPVAAQRAIAVCDQYARAGFGPAEQVAKTEAIMRREFPHLFDAGKPPPGVNEPSSRTATSSKRPKGVADLPKEARALAQDWVDRGLIPNLDAYASRYWADQER